MKSNDTAATMQAARINDIQATVRGDLAEFKDVYIRHPDVKDAETMLSDLFTSGALPAGAECGVLIGPSRSGKSTILERFQQRTNDEHRREVRIEGTLGITVETLPVAVVETPSGATLKSLAEATLKTLGDPTPATGSQVAKMSRVYKLLNDRCVGLLIFDEFQHLIDREKRNQAIAHKAADFVKSILNQKVCAVILSGMEGILDVMAANPQLDARCSGVWRMKPMGFETQEERKLFRRCLSEFEKRIPLPDKDAFYLTTPDVSARLHVATGGSIGILSHLLTNAIRIARRPGSEYSSLSLNLLEQAFERLSIRSHHGTNPFSVHAPAFRGTSKAARSKRGAQRAGIAAAGRA